MLTFPGKFKLINVGRDRVNRTTEKLDNYMALIDEVKEHLASKAVEIDDAGAVFAGDRLVGRVENVE